MIPSDPGHPDFEAHLATYRGFTRLLGWSIAGIATILILMAVFLTS